MSVSFRFLVLTVALLVAAAPSRAQSLPKWEVGLGLGVISVPFYRGADAGRSYILPIPYFKYRGRYLQVDEGGLRGKLFASDRLLLDISVAAGVPVPETSDGTRAGMRELHPTLEIGPQLEYRLRRARQRDAALWLRLPLRAAFSVDWNEFDDHGWVFAPYIEYETRNGGPRGPGRSASAPGRCSPPAAITIISMKCCPARPPPRAPNTTPPVVTPAAGSPSPRKNGMAIGG